MKRIVAYITLIDEEHYHPVGLVVSFIVGCLTAVACIYFFRR